MKVFIAGPRAITTLNSEFEKRIEQIMVKNGTILVGDATGVDSAVQQYLHFRGYKNVQVYASKGLARNNIGRWDVVSVEVEKGVKGFAFYAQKDMKMAEDADLGFMIWNQKSRGTLNNMVNLTDKGKKVVVYLLPAKKFVVLKTSHDVDVLARCCGKPALAALAKIKPQSAKPQSAEQMQLF